MKKLLILLWFIPFALSGQNPIIGITASQGAVAAGYDADYQTVYNALDVKPGADTAAAQNTLVLALKTAGVWANADLLYVTAQRTESGALLNWKGVAGSFNLVNAGGVLFTMYEGFTGDGNSGNFLATNFNPSTNGVNITQNDAGIAAYTRIDQTGTTTVIGATAGGSYIILYPRTATGNFIGYMNDAGTISRAVANSQGFYSVVRVNATTIRSYKNGSKQGADATVNSVALVNDNIEILAVNNGSRSLNQVSFIYVGGSLTDEQQTAFNTAVEAYMDFLGKGVE